MVLTDKEIDEVGFALEREGLSHSDIDAYFEHHGVKGMHWGIRRSKRTTGVTRPRGALIDRNDMIKNNIELARQGDAFRISTALARKFIGEEKQKQNWNQSMKNLNAQNKRLMSGRLELKDKVDLWGSVGIADLFVTVRPGLSPKKINKQKAKNAKIKVSEKDAIRKAQAHLAKI